jgi:hypothetical protein
MIPDLRVIGHKAHRARVILPLRCRASAQTHNYHDPVLETRQSQMFRVMQIVQEIFDINGIPAFLSDGSVLAWFHNCSVPLLDIEFTVYRHQVDAALLMVTLTKRGFEIVNVFGDPNRPGFQCSVQRDTVTVSCF